MKAEHRRDLQSARATTLGMVRSRAMALLPIAFFAMACGAEVDDIADKESVASAAEPLIVQGWLPSASEEKGRNYRDCGSDPASGAAVDAVLCTGDYCDNISLHCALPVRIGTDTSKSWWTPYVSDENSGSMDAFCIQNDTITGLIDGIRASGRWADNISVRCSPFRNQPARANCRFTGWASEEDGVVQFAADERAVGVQCRGAHCDDMRWYVCSFIM